jgi:hypothetical protein
MLFKHSQYKFYKDLYTKITWVTVAFQKKTGFYD